MSHTDFHVTPYQPSSNTLCADLGALVFNSSLLGIFLRGCSSELKLRRLLTCSWYRRSAAWVRVCWWITWLFVIACKVVLLVNYREFSDCVWRFSFLHSRRTFSVILLYIGLWAWRCVSGPQKATVMSACSILPPVKRLFLVPELRRCGFGAHWSPFHLLCVCPFSVMAWQQYRLLWHTQQRRLRQTFCLCACVTWRKTVNEEERSSRRTTAHPETDERCSYSSSSFRF